MGWTCRSGQWVNYHFPEQRGWLSFVPKPFRKKVCFEPDSLHGNSPKTSFKADEVGKKQ